MISNIQQCVISTSVDSDEPVQPPWFKHILLARTVDIIKQMLTVLKLQGLEWKQNAYIIPFLVTNNIL